eukprot:1377532-Pleurochrysis_carterae.AAC.8
MRADWLVRSFICVRVRWPARARMCVRACVCRELNAGEQGLGKGEACKATGNRGKVMCIERESGMKER